MIRRDEAFTEERRRFYEEEYRISEPIDPWHAYSQSIVHGTTKTWFYDLAASGGPRILNAGSGGSDYGIAEPMTHLDLFESRIAECRDRLVGDIAAIPAMAASFDSILCVGSVLNYADPLRAISEFARVLRIGGVLVLEYERSGSFEFRLPWGMAAACRRVETFYGRKKTHMWVYGDGFVDGLVEASGFRRLREMRFHALSSVALAATHSPAIAIRLTAGDSTVAQLWPFRNIASNRMLAVEKIADEGHDHFERFEPFLIGKGNHHD